MVQLEGYLDKEKLTHVWKLRCSLYGLKYTLKA